MAETYARIRINVSQGVNGPPINIQTGSADRGALPCKEWSICDDILNTCDTACVTVANIDGENAQTFVLGQRVEIELQNANVAGGKWVRTFTGLVTNLVSSSDSGGGSVIAITCMDVGWYLTSTKTRPHVNSATATFERLLGLFIDPSWGITEIRASNDLSRKLRQGRAGVERAFSVKLGAVLPYIQSEIGQSPIDIILPYAVREGVLLNAAADGALVFFRPDYNQPAHFQAVYQVDGGEAVGGNTIVGRPTLTQSIDGLYTETQCWSTLTSPQQAKTLAQTENPNAAFTHTTYEAPVAPLPFVRRESFSDPEAINGTLRKNRAIWKYQMGMFQSWQYECELATDTQNGAFLTSDSMIAIDDEINGVSGVYYVQRVQRSQTLSGGTRSQLLIRKPGLLNPVLTEFDVGGGAKKPAKVTKPGPSRHSKKIEGVLAKAKAARVKP